MRNRIRRPTYAPVSSVVFSGYWREHYTVLSHNASGSVTVRWHGDSQFANRREGPREGTHFTAMDWSRDRIIPPLPEPVLPVRDPCSPVCVSHVVRAGR